MYRVKKKSCLNEKVTLLHEETKLATKRLKHTYYSFKQTFMKKLLLLMVGLAIGFTAAAQTVVTGTIVDESEQPLIGATIIVPGTTQGTSSDLNGTFSLQVKKGAEEIQISTNISKSCFRSAERTISCQTSLLLDME